MMENPTVNLSDKIDRIWYSELIKLVTEPVLKPVPSRIQVYLTI